METISQECYAAPNFYTKANLVNHLIKDKANFSKALIFVGTQVDADRLFEALDFSAGISVIHAGKEQNHRTNAIEKFIDGRSSILIATDVISRGIDIEKIDAVISFNTPFYPENYIHRIGRTGRAQQQGKAILLYTEKETALKEAIESLMNYTITINEIPKEVAISSELTPEERPKSNILQELHNDNAALDVGASFHEKSAKNKKKNAKIKTYHRKLKDRYKKPQKRGDKIQNMNSKRKRK